MHLRKPRYPKMLTTAVAVVVDDVATAAAVVPTFATEAVDNPGWQFFQPDALDDFVDNLILKNIRQVLNGVVVGKVRADDINYKKLALALSIEHGETMRKRILDLLLSDAISRSSLGAAQALGGATPFLNETERSYVIRALIQGYTKENGRVITDCLIKIVGLSPPDVFFSQILLPHLNKFFTDQLIAILPLLQQVIIESAWVGESQIEVFRAANQVLNEIQRLQLVPRAALFARGIQPRMDIELVSPLPKPADNAIVIPLLEIALPIQRKYFPNSLMPAANNLELQEKLETLLNRALNEKDNLINRTGAFNAIYMRMNIHNHGQILERILLNTQSKSRGMFIGQYCKLLAKAFEFASPQNREKIKENLLAFFAQQANEGETYILKHIKKIMQHMQDQELVEFVRKAIIKVNVDMVISTGICADEKMVPFNQGLNLVALELLRVCQAIREPGRRVLDNQLDAVLQGVLSNQDAPILPKPVTTVATVYTKRF